MSAGIAVIVGPILDLLKPAFRRFAATTAGMWCAGGMVAAGAALGVSHAVAALSPAARAALVALTLLALAAAWAVAGVALGMGRAAGLAAESAVREYALARRLGEATAERLAEYARYSREGTSGPPPGGGERAATPGAAGAALGSALVTLERLPLADAEGFLRRAVDSLLGEGLPGGSPRPEGCGEGSPLPGPRLGRVKAAILDRIRAVALAKVKVLLLSEFRKDAGPGGGGGVDVGKVVQRLAGAVDGVVADMVRGQVRRVTALVVGGLLLASALPPAAAYLYLAMRGGAGAG